MDKKLLINRLLFGGIALVVALILFDFLRPFHRYTGQIPYLLSESFNISLRRYTQTRPSRNVLLITGAQKTGKSRAINRMANDMESTGHFVLNIDAARSSNNIFDFFKLIRHEVASSLVRMKQFVSSSDLKQIAEIEVPGVDINSIINSINLGNSSSPTSLISLDYSVAHVPIPNFPDPAFTRPYLAICAILENIYNPQNKTFSEWAVHRFFDALEIYRDVLQPAIFIHNIERIKSIKTREEPLLGVKIIEAAKARLSRRNHYGDFVPIFVEIKNSLVRINLDNDVFRIVQTDTPKNSYSSFVRRHKVFRRSEYKKIVNHFGYHIGTFSRIFEDLKYNVELDASIHNFQNYINHAVYKIYGKESSYSINEDSILKKLCRSQCEMRITNSTDFRALRPLFENGYLHLKKGFRVAPMNKGVTIAICSL